MRLHASGIGNTFKDAMRDLGDELDTCAAHANEVQFKQGDKGMEPVLETTRVKNPYREAAIAALEGLSGMVKPVEGYRVRILVSGADDKENAHVRLELDLVRN